MAVDRKCKALLQNLQIKHREYSKKLPETLLPLTKINNKKMRFKLKRK